MPAVAVVVFDWLWVSHYYLLLILRFDDQRCFMLIYTRHRYKCTSTLKWGFSSVLLIVSCWDSELPGWATFRTVVGCCAGLDPLCTSTEIANSTLCDDVSRLDGDIPEVPFCNDYWREKRRWVTFSLCREGYLLDRRHYRPIVEDCYSY